jgi:hypothetical protein
LIALSLFAQFTNGNWTFGQVFTPTTNIQVDFLGYFDPSTGMLDSHPVSFWNGTTGALVASSTITAASGFASTHFLFNMISPVTLSAGQIYEITGVSGIDNYDYGDTGWTLFAPVTYAGYNYCFLRRCLHRNRHDQSWSWRCLLGTKLRLDSGPHS